MKFSCEKALLQNAINIASRACAQKSSIPALEGILMNVGEDIVMSGFNMQIGIRTKIPAYVTETGNVVLNARMFSDIVRRMPDDVITMTCDEKLLVHLSCGASEFDIIGLAADSFPELPVVDEEASFYVRQNILKSLIADTNYAVSSDESRPIHTGSLFEIDSENITVVSVDGFRLALRKEKYEKANGAFTFVVPGNALNEIEKICEDKEDEVKIQLGNRHIMFKVEDTELISRRLEGEFLNYKAAIPRNNKISVKVKTKKLMESLDRVSVVINEKTKSPVRCHFGISNVAMFAKTANGEANDICPLEGDGMDLRIGFNNRYLMEALRYAPAEDIRMEMNTNVSPCVIVPAEGEENFLYMVLPVRLKEEF